METHLIVLNEAQRGAFDRQARKGRLVDWSATSKVEPGDVALFYFTGSPGVIRGVGVADTKGKHRRGPFSWTQSTRYVQFWNFKAVRTLVEPVTLAALARTRAVERWLEERPYRSSRRLSRPIAREVLAELEHHEAGVTSKSTARRRTATSGARGSTSAGRTDGISGVLARPLPVLFANIGWSIDYDGSESVRGGHGFLRRHAADSAEGAAFRKGDDGLYRCGVGRGRLPPEMHVALVARDPADRQRRVVGLYAAAREDRDVASPDPGAGWRSVATAHARMFPADDRPPVEKWVGRVRLWARNDTGKTHAALAALFNRLRQRVTEGDGANVDPDLEVIEGRRSMRLQVHRTRERKLRLAKIADVLRRTGCLACEVPGCGLDFLERYGELGRGYAHVHHREGLSAKPRAGGRVRLADVAIVCANCHAMIHLGHACRELHEVAPRRGRGE